MTPLETRGATGPKTIASSKDLMIILVAPFAERKHPSCNSLCLVGGGCREKIRNQKRQMSCEMGDLFNGERPGFVLVEALFYWETDLQIYLV